MRQLPVALIIISFTLVSIINGQVDPELCPNGPIVNTDPNWRPVPSRFEIMSELVSGNEVMELTQSFSPQRDAITSDSKLGPIQFYWNFVTNEQFEVLTAIINQQAVQQCLRQVLETSSQTSVIQPNTLIVKPSILLGFDPRNLVNTNWGVQSDGSDNLRGIPTNRFKACFYVPDIQATISATYQVSDITKFQAYLPANESIILQISINIKNRAGRRDSFTYNVFRYTPNPRYREERLALETPTGLFCKDRISTLSPPQNIPDRLSLNSEAVVPQANNSIFSSHGLFDTEFQFSRFDIWYPDPFGGSRWGHYTEIHDFGTGLSYAYNHSNSQCVVRDIGQGFNDAVPVDGRPELIQMGSPQHIFLMDDMTYQYTGERQCRDRVWCHVWIGENSFPNNTVQHRELYWASRVNGEPLNEWIPMKMIVRGYTNGIPIVTYEAALFNYRRNPFTIFEIDFTLSDCYRAMGPDENFNLAVLSFKIANDKNYPVFNNINYLRLHIFETLIFTLFVRPIRISNLLVDQDGSDIIVTFTLLDAPPRTGPVEVPLKETSLDTLIERFNTIIDSNGLAFRARYDTKQVTLRARPQTLNIDYQTMKEQKWISSGPKITGLWIGLIIVGLLVGVVGGFIVLAKLAK